MGVHSGKGLSRLIIGKIFSSKSWKKGISEFYGT